MKEAEELRAQIADLRDQLAFLESAPTMIPIPDRDYEIGETPVTVGQYRAFCNATDRHMPSQPKPRHEDNPVVNVTWLDAKAYCDWLSATSGDDFSLLTDDIYEHCCGDHVEGNPEIAVYEQSAITQVGTKQPNKFGLYDMLGLVWEWSDSNA